MFVARFLGWLHQFVGWLHSCPPYFHTSLFNEVWFQNLVLIVTAAIALVTLRTTSKHEQRRATVGIVRDQQKDLILIAARSTVRNMHYSPSGIDIKSLVSKTDSAELQAMFTVLNSYEFVATGLRTGAFDKKIYKGMYQNNVVTNWAMLKDFVVHYRVKYEAEHQGVKGMKAETLFQDFENLATKWESRPLKFRAPSNSRHPPPPPPVPPPPGPTEPQVVSQPVSSDQPSKPLQQ